MPIRASWTSLLGHCGDAHGRKNVLLLCACPHGPLDDAVGLIPTYQQVGIWAPILLVVLRLIQGFAVAGEISGASSMILEHSPFRTARLFRELHPARRSISDGAWASKRARSWRRRFFSFELRALDRCVHRMGLARPLPTQRAGAGRWLHHSARGR